MKTIKDQLKAGRADEPVADLKPHIRFEAVATCIRTYETNKDPMRCGLWGADCRSVPASRKALASKSSVADSREPGTTGRRRESAPCSPSNTAPKTTVGPASST